MNRDVVGVTLIAAAVLGWALIAASLVNGCGGQQSALTQEDREYVDSYGSALERCRRWSLAVDGGSREKWAVYDECATKADRRFGVIK